MNIITEHKPQHEMQAEVAKVLGGHLRTVLNQLVRAPTQQRMLSSALV